MGGAQVLLLYVFYRDFLGADAPVLYTAFPIFRFIEKACQGSLIENRAHLQQMVRCGNWGSKGVSFYRERTYHTYLPFVYEVTGVNPTTKRSRGENLKPTQGPRGHIL